jgi:hypothetical protein
MFLGIILHAEESGLTSSLGVMTLKIGYKEEG